MRFSIPAAVIAFYAAVSSASSPPEPDDADLDLSKVYIEGITYAGSGCKAGSVSHTNYSDWTGFTLAFHSFLASIGPDIPFVERRKNCNVNFKLHYPPDYQYTLYQANYTGYADLEDKVKATEESTYWFAGYSGRATLKSTLDGAFADNFSFNNTIDEAAWVWSPCGKSTTLNVNTQVYLNNGDNPKGYGYINPDFIDHLPKLLHTSYGLHWRKC
jgi:hypothetical protein